MLAARMDSEKKPRVSNAGAWGMNVVSSVGIIMANKQLMSPGGYGFSFGILSFPMFRWLISAFSVLGFGFVT